MVNFKKAFLSFLMIAAMNPINIHAGSYMRSGLRLAGAVMSGTISAGCLVNIALIKSLGGFSKNRGALDPAFKKIEKESRRRIAVNALCSGVIGLVAGYVCYKLGKPFVQSMLTVSKGHLSRLQKTIENFR